MVTGATILEALRLASPVALGLPSELTVDITIDNYILPKGNTISFVAFCCLLFLTGIGFLKLQSWLLTDCVTFNYEYVDMSAKCITYNQTQILL